MKSRFVVAAIAIVAASSCAQAQQLKPIVADARRLVKIVSGDKAKLQAYCDLAKTSDQIRQTMQTEDATRNAELVQKSDALARQVGPEFIALMDGLAGLDENSPDGDAVDKTLDELDRQCTK